MMRAILAVAAILVLRAGVSAQNPEPLPPPATSILPPIEAPAPPVPGLDPVTTPTVVVEPPAPVRFILGGDIGPVISTWRNGALVPSSTFAIRSPLFPVPTADYHSDIKNNNSIAARVFAGYTFEQLPITASVGWETYHQRAQTVLIGYDPLQAAYLSGLNDYNSRQREDENSGNWPRLQQRNVSSEAHELRSRTAVNIADATLAYKVWTPREKNGLEYRLLAGARYGGFFNDDRAVGYGYEQSASSWYAGGGPQGGLRIDITPSSKDPTRAFRFWLDARAGALFGEVTQRFREIDLIWGGATPYRDWVQSDRRTVPFVSTELGWGVGRPTLWFGIGVRYSQYWGVANIGPSRGDFGVVSGFLQLQMGY